MIYRGPGIPSVVRFGSFAHHLPHPPSPDCNLSLFLNLPVCRRSKLLTGGGGGGGRGAKPYNHEKAWPSINHSVLSGALLPCRLAESVLAKNVHVQWCTKKVYQYSKAKIMQKKFCASVAHPFLFICTIGEYLFHDIISWEKVVLRGVTDYYICPG